MVNLKNIRKIAESGNFRVDYGDRDELTELNCAEVLRDIADSSVIDGDPTLSKKVRLTDLVEEIDIMGQADSDYLFAEKYTSVRDASKLFRR